MSNDNDSRSTKFFTATARAVGVFIGMLFGLVALVALFIGAGLAVGRSVDLLQGAVSRPLSDWTAALDGWAILFSAYVLLWLPASALARSLRGPPREVLDVDD